MKVAKWGNSLAIRLPAELVARLGLVEGDELDVVEKGKALEISRPMTAEEAFANLRSFEGRLPKDFKFDREEAHKRGKYNAD